MDRMVQIELNGIERSLNYSIEIMFDVHDKYKTVQAALDIIEQDNADAFKAVQWFAIRMINDAELCRRNSGYSPQPMVTEKDITPRMHPVDYDTLRNAVVEAIILGYKREINDDDEKETDLGLEELRAKKVVTGA